MSYVPIEKFAAFRGYDKPIRELYNEIGKLGWSVQSVDSNNDGLYECKAKNPDGKSITRNGPDPATAVGNVLLYAMRSQYGKTAAQIKLGMWQTDWTHQLEPIAKAYADAPVYDPKAAPAWMELAHDSEYRAEVLRKQLHIEVTDNPEPYSSSKEMCDDVHNNKHFFVSRANSDHPLWTVDQNVNFRIVHDILGHCVSGGDFGWQGENLACRAHFPLLSPNAQKALFTECIAQTGYGAHYRGFGPQKVAIIPHFIEPAQQAENPGNYTGVHPSQSLAPTSMPEVDQSPQVGLPKGSPAPHETGEYGVWSKIAQGNVPGQDINAGWQSGIDPIPYEQGGAGFLHHGDPIEAFKPGGVMDTASKIDTNWSNATKENGEADFAKMKQAIVNAFRVVLLSPRKDLQWNARHYNDISQVPANETDPKVYWDTLEQKRREWNTSRGYGEEDHMIYFKPRERFRQIIRAKHPELPQEQALKLADDTFWKWQMQEEERIAAEDQGKPENKRRDAGEINRRANEAVANRLKIYNAENDPKNDQISLLGAEQTQLDMSVPEAEIPDKAKYGAFMGTHLKSIAQISQHIDQLTQAALEDVHDHDGAGHHFRAAVLSLGISGVGPKVCSFAWLLLQPMTSQLATIDTHMMDVLGHDYDKEMNPRDYFKFERELQAGRDASGYGSVPLGAFQWGMWDYKRTGAGSHQDHSAMKVLDPVHPDTIDWASKAQNLKGDAWLNQAPQWWQLTQPARDAVASQWQDNVTPHFPQNQVPFAQDPSLQATASQKLSKPFSHWWDLKKPISLSDAKILAEYARGAHMSHSEAEDYIDKHKGDVEGSVESFKQKFFKEFSDPGFFAKVASSTSTPWFTHPLTKEKIRGQKGQTIMHHARQHFGWSTPMVWSQIPEAGKEAEGTPADTAEDASEGTSAS